MEKVLIIGAGPNAYIAAATCLESNLDIFMLSPNILDWKNFENSDLLTKPILKRRNDDFLFREPAGITKIKGKNVDVFENFLIGGLSELWGGVFLPPSQKEYLQKYSDLQARTEAIEFIEKNIEILNIDNHIYRAYKNLDIRDKTIDDSTPIAKSSFSHHRKWSAGEKIFSELFAKVKFIDGYLRTLEQTGPREIKAIVEDPYQNKILLNFNKVFIAAGVFGTARIILESLEGLTEIEIQDSRSTFKFGIKKGKEENHDRIKSMSPETIHSKFNGKGDVIKFVQVYRLSDELLNSIKYKWIKFCVQIFDKILFHKIRLIMSFYSGIDSKTIHVIKQGENLIAVAKNIKFMKIKLALRNKIRMKKISIITPEIDLKSGSGVHSGAFNIMENHSLTGLVSKDICDWPDVHILGSASLKSISAGPIMFHSMVNSRVIVKNVIDGTL